jgi:gamma-glutamyl AIG2-like cyclotransferase
MVDRRTDVFFYGLFMDEELLRSRGLRPEHPERAWVEGFGLRIGSRATLIPRPGKRVYGLVMSLTTSEVVKLYSEPSVQAYRPEAVVVHVLGGGIVAALCYNLPLSSVAEEASVEYVAKLRAVAQNVGLPPEYVSSIG